MRRKLGLDQIGIEDQGAAFAPFRAGDRFDAEYALAHPHITLDDPEHRSAIADIAGIWTLEKVTGALSDFADTALGLAAAQVLREAAGRGAFRLRHTEDPERDSGLVIIAMGKLGARELNYSSDIDLIVLFDPEKIDTGDPDALQNHFVRMTRALVRRREERSADGYVFRSDLRLRPDPGSTGELSESHHPRVQSSSRPTPKFRYGSSGLSLLRFDLPGVLDTFAQ